MDEKRYSSVDTSEDMVSEAASKAASEATFARDDGRRYTYSDYMTWDDDERWELIDGVPFLMSAPTTRHQEISGNLYFQLRSSLEGKPCKPFYAPSDVRLNADTLDNTVVQPDVYVLCDRGKLDKTGCKGAPDFVVEILSPSTSSRDMYLKFDLYRQSGVREYWIVEPDEKVISAHILSDEDYITRIYKETDKAPIHALDGCTIDLAEVFQEWTE